ncbi:MAG TPA: AMP-binding protein, partial [Pyrinomonadaceae bacterium]|nr:AMP-binding protein [Pyrinomonadaceae bacterium]
NRSETEGLIGFFVNTLALRVDFSGDPSFIEVLRRVREVTLGAYGHQDVPFERLVEELQPARDLSRNPLFQVLFALQNAPLEPLELPGLTISAQEFEANSTRFDLECHLSQCDEGFSGVFVYNTDLFDESTIRRFRSHFERLLDSIVVHAEENVASLPLLTADETQQLLFDWNDTATEFPQDLRIQDLFEEQVERTPDSIALVFAGEHLSYRELNTRANQLAFMLQEHGVAADSIVAISMERSFDMLLAILAALKAGGTYLPLDLQHPPERLALLLEEARPCVVLTQQAFAARFAGVSAPVICLDSDWESIADRPEHNPSSNTTAGNLLYTLYTSGSTGRPKAIAMPHRSLVNMIAWQVGRSRHGMRTTQFASLSFDVSFQEIFSTLCSGGTLALVDEGTRRDSHALLSLLNE